MGNGNPGPQHQVLFAPSCMACRVKPVFGLRVDPLTKQKLNTQSNKLYHKTRLQIRIVGDNRGFLILGSAAVEIS